MQTKKTSKPPKKICDEVDMPVLDFHIRRSPFTGHWWVENQQRDVVIFSIDEESCMAWITGVYEKKAKARDSGRARME